MGQQSLIYAFVARGTVILAEYTEFTGNFTTIASQCLMKLPASNNKFTYNCDGHTFNYLVEDGFTYCVVAVESVGRQVPIAFLDRVKEDFTKRYGGGKAATAAANSLNREFGSKLKEHMQYCVDHPEEISKLAKVQAQVSEVKGVMMENIEKVLDRGEKIELLVDKTENLRSQAQDFRQQGTKSKESRLIHSTASIILLLRAKKLMIFSSFSSVLWPSHCAQVLHFVLVFAKCWMVTGLIVSNHRVFLDAMYV
uniref:Longin domain-containing protein n=1 Tax=Setaria italica TaxID=4555 RepID=K4AE39_SETIT